MPFAATGMDLEIIILSEVSQTEKDKILYDITYMWNLKHSTGTSLVAQWLRIRLPIQGTQVRALVREGPTCRRATRPVRHNY